MMVGLPMSGKSTVAGKLSKEHGWPVVCPDNVRLALHGKPYIREREQEVWSIVRVMVKALFLSGHDRVILDSTNITATNRAQWNNENWARFYVRVPTDAQVCLERARKLNKTLITVIKRMDEMFDPIIGDQVIEITS